jgi:hypothetical protein
MTEILVIAENWSYIVYLRVRGKAPGGRAGRCLLSEMVSSPLYRRAHIARGGG